MAAVEVKTGTLVGPSAPDPPPPPACPMKMVVFTVNLLIGLSISQAVPGWLGPDDYYYWKQVVKLLTMFCLSYIMINVGYEFDIDKSKLGQYGSDYFIAMTAAGFPWIFVAVWFVYVLPDPLPWKEALVAARFAAPTSAGILFSMLEAAGMKETWLFQKARILAIFDDLDTILLMVPLKVIIVGMKWELSIDLFFVIVLLGLAWRYLHAVKIPVSAMATIGYATVVTAVCETVHVLTHYHIDAMDTVHLEVLLPAFAIGCIARSAHAEHRFDESEQPPALPKAAEVVEEGGASGMKDGEAELPSSTAPSCTGGTHDNEVRRRPSKQNEVKPARMGTLRRLMTRRGSLIIEEFQLAETENIHAFISAVFMVLVGLSMPPLAGDDTDEAHRRLAGAGGGHDAGEREQMPAGEIMAHVVAVSVLMVIGKMFPTFCYSKEANLRTRFALSIGMCPRGEVGAGVIVISLGFGIKGQAITIAVISLAINLILSSGFIMAVKHLAKESSSTRVVPFKPEDADSSQDQ